MTEVPSINIQAPEKFQQPILNPSTCALLGGLGLDYSLDVGDRRFEVSLFAMQ
jgi:hypothetical protein